MTHAKWLLVAIASAPTALMAPTALVAQGGEWPTLTGAGIEYLSRTGAVQVSLSGQLDLETVHVRDSWAGLVAREGGYPVHRFGEFVIGDVQDLVIAFGNDAAIVGEGAFDELGRKHDIAQAESDF